VSENDYFASPFAISLRVCFITGGADPTVARRVHRRRELCERVDRGEAPLRMRTHIWVDAHALTCSSPTSLCVHAHHLSEHSIAVTGWCGEVPCTCTRTAAPPPRCLHAQYHAAPITTDSSVPTWAHCLLTQRRFYDRRWIDVGAPIRKNRSPRSHRD
jgi:hypothetical protein